MSNGGREKREKKGGRRWVREGKWGLRRRRDREVACGLTHIFHFHIFV